MGAHGLRRLLLAAAVALTVLAVLWDAGLFEQGRAARGLRNFAVFFGEMVPPEADAGLVETLLLSLWETVQMAWAGTVLGALLALPLAVLATEHLATRWVARPVRALLAGVRTVPSILWAIVFVV